jgi:hypothetical protein
MDEENRGFWDKVFNTRTSNEREQRVIEYICHRIADGAHLGDVTQEEYVRRNASPDEVQAILDNPKLIEAAHESMREEFSSGKLDPNPPPSSAG